MPPTTIASPAAVSLIPHPAEIRQRLGVARAEARFLARLLRLAEDRLHTLPECAVGSTAGPVGKLPAGRQEAARG